MNPKELNIFFNAVLYYTRIKVPKSVICTDRTLSKAFRYFPLVGLGIGALGALIFTGASCVLPLNVSVILSLTGILLITGGLHEDGLADFCDGFGGGRDKESILRIMKDSHIGTYGVLSLIILFLLKYTLLINISPELLIWVIICANGAGRFNPVLMIRLSKYARNENSKSMHTKLGVSYTEIIPAFIFGYAPLFLFGYAFALTYILAATIILFLFRAYLNKKTGGFTGDTLGALIQFSELVFYMLFIIFSRWSVY